ncbi:hypothetical protein EB796_014111 [Bugula neritina]|uniref:Uncharacterized protein n=1 Tax=Bugula neritina TaxID=10212 RepID=A0A7J7JMQ0_BUGNE|nr:hypothetical protein EB796_014110 [Bugula neritina]KAF6027590.1 hypothetical protein EB796_014111 [Bugula neritina]
MGYVKRNDDFMLAGEEVEGCTNDLSLLHIICPSPQAMKQVQGQNTVQTAAAHSTAALSTSNYHSYCYIPSSSFFN